MAGSMTNAAELDVLELIFNAVTWLDIAEDKVSTPTTDLWVSLHTAALSDTSDQSTSETVYTNYARKDVARTTVGWTVSGDGNCANTAAVTFATCGATGATLTYFGIGNANTGAGNLLFWGDLTSSLVVSNGITPEFAAGALDVDAA